MDICTRESDRKEVIFAGTSVAFEKNPIQIQSGSRGLMTKNLRKIIQLKFFSLSFFGQNLKFTYP